MLGDPTGDMSPGVKGKLEKMIKENVSPAHMQDIPLEHMFFCQLMALGGTPEWSFERCFPKLVETTDDWPHAAMELYLKYKPFIIISRKKMSDKTEALPGTENWIMSMLIVEALDQRPESGDTSKALKGMVELIKMRYDNRYKELCIEEKKIQIEKLKEPLDKLVDIEPDFSVKDEKIEKLSLEERKEMAEKMYQAADEDDMQNKLFGEEE